MNALFGFLALTGRDGLITLSLFMGALVLLVGFGFVALATSLLSAVALAVMVVGVLRVFLPGRPPAVGFALFGIGLVLYLLGGVWDGLTLAETPLATLAPGGEGT